MTVEESDHDHSNRRGKLYRKDDSGPEPEPLPGDPDPEVQCTGGGAVPGVH